MQITSYLSSADGTIDTCNETFQDTEYEAMTDQSSKLAHFNGEHKDWMTWKKPFCKFIAEATINLVTL